MISYLLANGKSGNIDDPWALRAFYTRLYYGNIQRQKSQAARRSHGQGPTGHRPAGQEEQGHGSIK
jgi:hypothetical protein